MNKSFRKEISIFPNANSLGGAGLKNGIRKECNLSEVHNIIQKQGWSPALFKNDARLKKNFEAAYYIGLDIDGGTTIEKVATILDEHNLCYSISCTKSHQVTKDLSPAADRFRVVLESKSIIRTEKQHGQILEYIRKYLIPEIDPQCLDCSRGFFASSSPMGSRDNILKLAGEAFAVADIKLTIAQKVLGEYDLHDDVKYFIHNAEEVEENREWNGYLNKLSFDLALQGSTKELILELSEELAPDKLDKHDLATIDSGFKSGNAKFIEKGGTYKASPLEILMDKIIHKTEHLHIYKRDNSERSILLENEDGEVSDVSKIVLIDELTNIVSEEGLFKSVAQVRNLAEYFKSKSSPITPPVLISFKNDSCLSYVKIDHDSTQTECPLFMEFLGRCSNPDTIAAFIWSLFIMESNTQQYLWLYGDGQDGKGTLLQFLQKLLKHTYCVADSRSIGNDNFYNAQFVGKRLAAYPDNSNERLPTTDIFKSLTGGDAIPVNAKYNNHFTFEPNLKIIVLSNCLPAISSQKSDIRRAIISRIETISTEPINNYSEELFKEKDAILTYCRSKYEKLTNNHSIIGEDNSYVVEVANINEENNISFTDHFLEFGVDFELKPHQLQQLIQSNSSCWSIDRQKFKSWLLRTHKLQVSRASGVRVIKGIRLRSQSSQAFD